MPGWYKSVQPYLKNGSLVMLGVIQEQHADRCRLFQQWQGLDFPVVQDQLNTNGIAVVPVYVGIDEHGVVRSRPRRMSDFKKFMEASFEAPAKTPSLDASVSTSAIDETIQQADDLILWKGDKVAAKKAIGLYRTAIQKTDSIAKNEKDKRSDLHFRMGAAKRLLYELTGQQDPDLFGGSVEAWETALAMNPNQYIYRRRIEQYGPRLKKPYSFYDWVSKARKEIAERGEQPIPLFVEPNGAELAQRARQMSVDADAVDPDPTDVVTRDQGELVKVHVNVVPTKPKPGDVVAVHLGFYVNEKAKWNHETEPLKVWIEDAGKETVIASRLVNDETPYRLAESRQPISISFEMKLPQNHTGPLNIKGYALFNICETENGQCVYRRRDFRLSIPE